MELNSFELKVEAAKEKAIELGEESDKIEIESSCFSEIIAKRRSATEALQHYANMLLELRKRHPDSSLLIQR